MSGRQPMVREEGDRRRRLGRWLPAWREWPLLALLLAFATLGMRYARTTPAFEAPNEPQHLLYALRLAAPDGGLPSPDDAVLEEVATQPPLYYALGALVLRAAGAAPEAVLYEPNPFARPWQADEGGNKNVALHKPGQSPRPEAERAVLGLRWLSLLAGAGVVALCYRLALQVAPDRRGLATGVAALLAFNPQYLFVAASASNETLVALFSAGALLAALCLIDDAVLRPRRVLLLGALIGLAMLSHPSGALALLLLPTAGALRALRPGRRTEVGWLALWLVLGLALAAAVAGWWYLRSAGRLEGAPSLPTLMGLARAGEEVVAGPAQRVVAAVDSLWGLFGWGNVLAEEAYYSAARIITVLGLVGLVPAAAWVYWRGRSWDALPWRAALVSGTYLVAAVVLLAYGGRYTGRYEGRALFVAAPVLALCLHTGLTGWLPRRYQPLLSVAATLLLGTAAWIAPTRYILPAYAPPPLLALEQVPHDLRDLNASFGDELFLLGYELPKGEARVGEVIEVRLYWVGLRAMERDYQMNVALLGREERVLSNLISYPAGGTLPTSAWVPGDVLAEEYRLQVPADAEVPVAGQIRVSVCGAGIEGGLPARDAQGSRIGESLQVARVRLLEAEPLEVEPPEPLDVAFGGLVALEGYRYTPTSPYIGEKWEVTLYWRGLAPVPADYTVFLHLVDRDGETVVQRDAQPLDGDYPTSMWLPGQQVRDRHVLEVPDDLPVGQHYVRIGLYLLDTGERLVVAEGDPPLTYVTLGPFEVR